MEKQMIPGKFLLLFSGVQDSDATIGLSTAWRYMALPSFCLQQRRAQSSGKIFSGIPLGDF